MTNFDSVLVTESFVVHVVPANGGGVDRYVRDICSRRNNDWILHVGELQVVLEHPRENAFFPIDTLQGVHRGADSYDEIANVLGQPSLVHAHSAVPGVRAVVKAICVNTKVDYVVTLHDIEFAQPVASVPQTELAERAAFAKMARVRIAPSSFIADLADKTLDRLGTCIVIPNGVTCEAGLASVDSAAAATKSSSAIPRCRVAVVGALGPHKGLQFLHEVVARRSSDQPIVVVGYVDGQLSQGWLNPNSLWIHGAFEPSQLCGILDKYGVELVLFPNRQPESYSYTLSDVWCAGRPVLVPDAGALSERVRETEAGWIYAVDSTPMDVARLLDLYLNQTALISQKVRDATEKLNGIDDMVSELNAVYERVSPEQGRGPVLNDVAAVAAKHLNGVFFRAELRRLSGDLAFAQRQRDERDASIAKLLADFEAERRLQAATADALQAECRRLENERLVEHEAYSRNAAKLEADVRETLAAAHRYERALAFLPRPVRSLLLRRADKGKAQKDSRD